MKFTARTPEEFKTEIDISLGMTGTLTKTGPEEFALKYSSPTGKFLTGMVLHCYTQNHTCVFGGMLFPFSEDLGV
jgi:hypothetical protein